MQLAWGFGGSLIIGESPGIFQERSVETVFPPIGAELGPFKTQVNRMGWDSIELGRPPLHPPDHRYRSDLRCGLRT